MTRSSSPKSSASGRAPRSRKRATGRKRRPDPSEAAITRRIAQGDDPEAFLCLDCYCWSLDPALCGCWTRAVFIGD